MSRNDATNVTCGMRMSDEPGDLVALQRKLRWQCRRGMKELDLVLVRYLDAHFSSASAEEQQNFVRLLESEDDQLWAWILGRSNPQDPELDALVQRIRGAD
jgi:antitoxin CptB